MTWRDHLRPAAFRGVPFHVLASSRKVGRRAVLHQFPQRERPLVEDVGREADTWKLDAYVIGDDYMERRDRLVARCRAIPPGYPNRAGAELVHPYYGIVRVHCLSCEVKETAAEGRMARLVLTLVEVGEDVKPFEDRPAPQDRIDEAAEATEAAAEAVVADELVVENVPEDVRAAAENETVKLGELIDSLDVFGGPADKVAELAAQVELLTLTATALVKAPTNLAATIRESVAAILSAASSFRGAFYGYRFLFGFSPALEGGAGSTAISADSNATLVANLIREAAVAEAARAAVRMDWETLEEATEARGWILDELDLVVGNAADSVYLSLQNLRSAIVESIPPEGETLPRLRRIELTDTIPAALLSWKLYGTPNRQDEIAVRNRAPYSTFLPGGSTVEVVVSD